MNYCLERQKNLSFDDFDKAIEETIRRIKPLEERRDKEQAIERLKATSRALKKHDTSKKEPGQWGWIPKSIINNDEKRVSSQAYGLLVVLAMNATIPPIANGRKIVPRTTPTVILRWLGLTNSNRRPLIAQLLGELEDADIIKRDGEDIELLFPTLDEAKDKNNGGLGQGGFVKIYASTYQAILTKSHGIATLNRLAVYLGFRYNIFEAARDAPNRVVWLEGAELIPWVVDLSYNAANNNLNWLRENGILSWNLIQNENKYHNKKYLITEHFHVREMVMNLCYWLLRGSTVRVLA